MEIISYVEAPAGAKYIAEVEVYHNKTYYRRIRIMVSQKGHHFVNLPVFGLEDGQGGKKWVQFWEWSKAEDEEFKRTLLSEVQIYIQRKGGAVQPVPAAAPERSYNQPNLGDCPF